MVQSNLPVLLKAIPGTLQLHQVVAFPDLQYLQHRVLSCFCQIDKGEVCQCFELKKHLLPDLTINKIPDNVILSTSNTSNLVDTENISGCIPHDSNSVDLTQIPSHDSISVNEMPGNVIPIPSTSNTSNLVDTENLASCILPRDSTLVDLIQVPPHDTITVDLTQIPDVSNIYKTQENYDELGDLYNFENISELADTDIPDLSMLLFNESCPKFCERVAKNDCIETSITNSPSNSTSLTEKRHEEITPLISLNAGEMEVSVQTNLSDESNGAQNTCTI
ncbi:hypothetical protein EVAR_32805_1 [Eumeta japonica]|uniref:Uncharacterized protein n=1 Tax=Eumeta variegata TaxID=151549 RepID=A0A4C1WCI3_EUMVA|nr:hypothetical protein EVAR_32805_1 [Eumeta japonica]